MCSSAALRYLRQHERIARLVTIGWTLLQRCIGGYVEWTMYSEYRCSLRIRTQLQNGLSYIVHYIVSRGRIWTQPSCPWSVRAALLVRPSCQMYAFHSFVHRESARLYILHTALHTHFHLVAAPHHQKCPRTCSSVGMQISHWCDCDVGKMRRSRGQGAQAEGCLPWKFNLTHLT